MPRRSQSPPPPSRHTRAHRSRSPSRQRSNRDRRSRNDSPPHTRQRSGERDYHRNTRSDHSNRHRKRTRSPPPARRHSRSRSRSPQSRRHLARSGSPSPTRPGDNTKEGELAGEALQGMTEEEQMSALMGFSGFDTTKNKHVNGNDVGSANVKKQRKFRQYMNRKGGFNRLLDKQTM